MKKSFLAIMMLFFASQIFCFVSNIFAYSGGLGTADDPYIIDSKADLLELSANAADYDKCFILTADIDMDGQVFTTALIAQDINISRPGFQGMTFKGVFDGNNHKISNFDLNGENNDFIGLFGIIDSGGTVKNLTLEKCVISGTDHVGGLVGVNGGSISNCYSTGLVSGGSNTGGLVGLNDNGILDNCYSTGSVNGTSYVGGLAGHNYGNITNCYSMGNVSSVSDSFYSGGLVGYNDGSITNCYSIGAVNGSSNVGGLAGHNGCIITNCYSIGAVNGSSNVGGLVGKNNGSITNCYSTSGVSGSSRVGGLLGYNYYGIITHCFSTGSVIGNSYVGGLVGSNYKSAVNVSFWDTQTSGQTTSAGGEGKTTEQMQDINTFLNAGWDFINETANGASNYWQMPVEGGYPVLSVLNGYIPAEPFGGGTEDNPYFIADANDLGTIWFRPSAHYILTNDIDLAGIQWSASVSLVFSGSFDGNGFVINNLFINGGGHLGLFGKVETGSKIQNLGLENCIISETDTVVGSLAANNDGSINNCYSTGNVSGSYYVGGLVGYNNGSITNCYSTSSVSGSYYVGGLVGGSYDGAIINSCSTGTVSGYQDIGGLVGNNYYSIITDCYSTDRVSGNYSAGGLVGCNSYGIITRCYSTGSVSSNHFFGGGLVGKSIRPVTSSFWDIQTSGQTTSAGGEGKTTAQMQDINTFLNTGWDFVNEIANGPNDIWFIREGKEYPRFVWENNKPIADAGPNQVAYAWLDGLAEVTLDGSNSYDPDGDELEYFWWWSINGNDYEAEGVNPIIELPFGEHQIELVVNDGLDDSEPNYTTVSVIGPIRGALLITPQMIFSQCPQKRIMAKLILPAEITRNQIDTTRKLTLYPGGIEATNQCILPSYAYGAKHLCIFAYFGKDDVLDAIGGNRSVKVYTVGKLKTGQFFYGSDTIRIFNPRRWPRWGNMRQWFGNWNLYHPCPER